MKLNHLFEESSKIHLLLLFVLCYITFFLFNESFFVNIMEARNFVTAREMIEKGNWLVPTMNGELRLAKPPFPTWITAMFGSYFGMTDLAMLRFPAGIMGCLLVLFMYQFSMDLTGKKSQAFTNSLILTSSFYVLYMSRTGTWDIYCHSFMLGAIWILFNALQNYKCKRVGKFSFAGVLLGLSFLSKGPVAFFALLIPFFIAYCWIYKSKSLIQNWKPLLLCVLIFAIISFWWPVYISVAHADSAAAVAKLESGSWMNRHVRPFYYYWNFPIQTGIWTVLIFSALLFPIIKKNLRNKKEYLFALIWTLSSVVLLSLIPEKKDRYLLPVLIPSAILAGQLTQHLYEVFSEKKNKTSDLWIFGINVWTLTIVAFALPMVVFHVFFNENQLSITEFTLFTISSELLFVLFLLTWINKNVRQFLINSVLLMCIPIVFLIPNLKGFLNQNPDFKNLSEINNYTQYKELNYYSIGKPGFRIELVYEAGKEVKEWDFESNIYIPQEEPFVVFSTKPVTDLLSNDQLKSINFKTIDHFDYNRYHQGKKRNKPHFQKYATLITPIKVLSESDSIIKQSLLTQKSK